LSARGDGTRDDQRRNRRHGKSDLVEKYVGDHYTYAVLTNGCDELLRQGIRSVKEP
jgi:hypothetical protein